MSRLKLLGRRALPALLVALLAAGAATPAGASLTRPEVARLAGDVRPALDPRGLELGRLAASARSDPAPAALPDGACSAPVVGPILDPVLDPDPAPELVPVLVGVLIPLDELALPPALDPTRVIGKTFGDLVVGLCRRDVAAVSGSGSSETRLRGEIEPGAAQPQAISIFSCVLAAGSSHTPYGEAHAETGPELLRARYDNDLSEVRTVGGTVTQTVADETVAAPGGVLLSWSLPLDETTLAAGLLVEQLQAGAGWSAVPAGELVIGHRPDDGTSTGDDATNLRVLLASGWQRGTSYRIRLTQELTDRLHRSYGQGPDQVQDLQWSIPVATDGQPLPAVQYDQRFPAVYESYQAAAATAGGRFPAGQNRLFQGLWTDPVTGMSYARARWYDARNAHWLSEDPLGAVDSTNLYAFVGWQPNMGTDPMGECLGFNDEPCYVVADRWAANLQAKKEELSVGGSGWGSVALNTVTGTAIDAVELFAIDPLRAGASTGEAIGSGGDALDITVAIVEDAGRVAVLAGAAGGTVKTVGRGARGLRRAFTLSDEIGEAVSAGLREGAAEGISELRPRFKEPRIPRRGAQFFDDLARQSTKNPTSAKVVIGKWQEANKSYTKVAAHYRASYFKATNWRELTRTLTADELWKINEAFLDQQIQAGKQIFLSHDPSAATGFFLNEVQYLEDLGYRFVQHNWVWKALR